MRIQVGSKWLCTDVNYPAFDKTCEVLEVHDNPDFNGDGEIEVKYENGEIYVSKVRRFQLRHDKIA